MKRWLFGIIAAALLLCGCRAEQSAVPPLTPEPIIVIATAPPDVSAVPVATPPGTAAPVTESPLPSDVPEYDLLRERISRMTLQEKIGQICMFGFSGTKAVSSTFSKMLQEDCIGNVILYGQNINRDKSDGGFSDCRKLTDSIRAAMGTDIPPLISIDVEGGTVTRFHWSKSLDSARTLGKKNDTDRARAQFARIGEGLREAGVNMDLAPVLDITDNASHFLGTRVISSDPEITATIGIACIEGLHDANVLSFVKHFPGHGAIDTDSHDKTPVSRKSLDSLRGYDLIPFEVGLREADGVLVGHLLFSAVDDAHIASQSFRFITELLRWEYGFDGIVMSDDFRMEGLRKQTSLGEGAVQFLLAGGDLILCGANHDYQREILNGLWDAVSTGRLTETRLDESVYRILAAKERLGLLNESEWND